MDPKINPEMMEMYAEVNARGGVLEPEGIVQIKYRRAKILATMERLDAPYRELKTTLNGPNISNSEKLIVQSKLEAREKEMYPHYYAAALSFAELHDTPERMYAKGAISRIISWKESRRVFYWRLLRRISEENIITEFDKIGGCELTSRPAMKLLLKKWFIEDSLRKSFDHQTIASL